MKGKGTCIFIIAFSEDYFAYLLEDCQIFVRAISDQGIGQLENEKLINSTVIENFVLALTSFESGKTSGVSLPLLDNLFEWYLWGIDINILDKFV
jgi:hypothetical protein